MTYNIKQNDRLPELQLLITDKNGAVVDLTPVSILRLIINRKGTNIVDVTDADSKLTVTPLAGQVDYAWDVGETATVGRLEIEIHLTWNDGRTQRIPTKGFTEGRITKIETEV